jgi:hypothetical protein
MMTYMPSFEKKINAPNLLSRHWKFLIFWIWQKL